MFCLGNDRDVTCFLGYCLISLESLQGVMFDKCVNSGNYFWITTRTDHRMSLKSAAVYQYLLFGKRWPHLVLYEWLYCQRYNMEQPESINQARPINKEGWGYKKSSLGLIELSLVSGPVVVVVVVVAVAAIEHGLKCCFLQLSKVTSILQYCTKH